MNHPAASAVLLLSCSALAAGRDLAVSHRGAEGSAGAATRGMLTRLLPKQANGFVLETIPAAGGRDVFEVESRNGKVVLRGNNSVSTASALNWYLKYYCHSHVSLWGNNLQLPYPLPMVKEKVRRASPFRYRYY